MSSFKLLGGVVVLALAGCPSAGSSSTNTSLPGQVVFATASPAPNPFVPGPSVLRSLRQNRDMDDDGFVADAAETNTLHALTLLTPETIVKAGMSRAGWSKLAQVRLAGRGAEVAAITKAAQAATWLTTTDGLSKIKTFETDVTRTPLLGPEADVGTDLGALVARHIRFVRTVDVASGALVQEHAEFTDVRTGVEINNATRDIVLEGSGNYDVTFAGSDAATPGVSTNQGPTGTGLTTELTYAIALDGTQLGNGQVIQGIDSSHPINLGVSGTQNVPIATIPAPTTGGTALTLTLPADGDPTADAGATAAVAATAATH